MQSGLSSSHIYPDRFYPVVDSVAWVARLAKLGVGTIQFRAKGLTHDEAVLLMREALGEIAGTPAKFVVNDYWQAAIDVGAKHVHLGHEDVADADVKAIRRAGLTLGLSTHDDAELDIALSHQPDYIALGPIYTTTVKELRFAPQGVAKVSVWKKRIGKVPLVAIGGIRLEQAAEIFLAGADSIAVVTDITRNPDPDARVRGWLKLTDMPAVPA